MLRAAVSSSGRQLVISEGELGNVVTRLCLSDTFLHNPHVYFELVDLDICGGGVLCFRVHARSC